MDKETIKELREVEKILLMYLDPQLRIRKLSGKDVNFIHRSFLNAFQLMYEEGKGLRLFHPPPWLGWGETLKKGLDFYLPIFSSPDGAINKPEHFGYGLAWIVSTLKQIPQYPLRYPDMYERPIMALKKSPDNKAFYEYINAKLRKWYEEIKKQSDFIRKYPKGYRKMTALIS